MKPISFALQFRGQVVQEPGVLRKTASAPGCALATSLAADGLRSRFVRSYADYKARPGIRPASACTGQDQGSHGSDRARLRETINQQSIDLTRRKR